MGRRKASDEPKPEMPKPPYQIGETVDYKFLGHTSKGKILNLRKNPTNISRWIYDLQDIYTGRKIPYVGFIDTEEFANIILK